MRHEYGSSSPPCPPAPSLLSQTSGLAKLGTPSFASTEARRGARNGWVRGWPALPPPRAKHRTGECPAHRQTTPVSLTPRTASNGDQDASTATDPIPPS